MHAPDRSQRGFSLVEALVASAILIGGVASVCQLFMLAAAATRGAGDATRSAILASQKVEELRAMPWPLMAGGADTVAPFARRWSIQPAAVDPSGTAVIAVVVERPGRGASGRVSLVLLRTPDITVTLTDVMAGAALTMAISGAALSMVTPARGLIQLHPGIADLHQRTRVAVTALTAAILDAETVRPYRVGPVNADPPGTFRRNTLSVVSGAVARTYYLHHDADGSVLRVYDGDRSELPLVDHVVGLEFDYFGGGEDAAPAPLDDAATSLGTVVVRRVRVRLRMFEAAPASLRGPAGALFARGGTSTSAERFLPDERIEFDVALRVP